MSVDRDAVNRMLAGYDPMIRRFISGDFSADQFETEFLSYFKSDTTQAVVMDSTSSMGYSGTSTSTWVILS